MAVQNTQNGFQNSGGYAPKMDNALATAVKDWWQGLTKEEILAYLADQPDITADHLRNMIGNEQCVLAFGLRFDASTHDVVTDFCNGQTR